jgi:predicted nucleotidyltransferase
MSSSGGRHEPIYFPNKPRQLQDLIRRTQEETGQNRLDSDVNQYLQELLAKLNERNPERVRELLEEIVAILGEHQEIERYYFGGSVAKHTYVDGLSDIDALVILDRRDLQGKTPREVLHVFLASLQEGLTHDEVAEIDKGNLAVKVTYVDRTEIQLLPAIRHGREVSISDANGTGWKKINPKLFHRELTKANERLNNALVPTIKLVKSILSGLPDDLRPTGYHAESLSLDATKGYRGPMTVKSLLLHVLTAASTRVLRPIIDITNQSTYVDDYMGRKGSQQRERLSLALAGISRRLNAATTLDRWKEIIET